MTSTLVCDLDGVVYRGGRGIAGAGEALTELEEAGWRILFCTNNSMRRVAEVAAKIRKLTGYRARTSQIVGSAAAAATLLEDERPPTFVLGGDGIREALAEAHIPETADAAAAAAVVVGLAPDCDYEMLTAVVTAVRRGARFVATNADPTYPAEEGMKPGAGAILAAVETAAERRAEVAGKPHAPMRRLLRARGAAGDVWVVGDREDTDLDLARAEGWRSVLVLTGATVDSGALSGPVDLVVRSVADLPDHLG